MIERPVACLSLLLVLFFLVGCETPTDPAPPERTAAVEQAASKSGGPIAQATGGGHYAFTLLDEVFPGDFSFGALQFTDGRAEGQLRYGLDLLDGIPGVIAGGVIDFHGRVTCVSVDLANGRAWIGGVVTQNNSTQPDYRDDPTTQVGKDIWFRVLDAGEGPGEADRTTFVGFEGGGGIITSEEYCEEQIWPDDNARTHPITQGNVQVHE